MLAIHDVEIENRDDDHDPVELKLNDLALQHMDESTDWIFNHFHCTEATNYLEIRGHAKKKRETFSLVNFFNHIEGEIGFLHIVDVNLDNTNEFYIRPTFKFKWRFLHIEPLGVKKLIVRPDSPKMKFLCEACTENSTLRLKCPSHNLAACKSALQILKFCVDSPIDTLELFGGFEGVEIESFGIFKSLKCLKFQFFKNGDMRSVNIMNKKFFSMFPNVTKLQLHLRSANIFENITLLTSSFKNVHTLSLDFRICLDEKELIDAVLNNIRFPRLES